MKQLHDKRRKVYDIVNKLHDQRLSEQKGGCVCVCVCVCLCTCVCMCACLHVCVYPTQCGCN